MKAANLKVLHPSGVRMRFTESLANYMISRRPKSTTFRFGDWLSHLDDDQFQALHHLAERWRTDDDSPQVDDFVGAALAALSAERGGPVETDTEELQTLIAHCSYVVVMESFRRAAWLEFAAPLTTDPNQKIGIRVTEEGFKAHERMNALDPMPSRPP